jgi:hypothetical protein
MNAQEQVKPEQEAQQIWDQLDAEDAGSAPAPSADDSPPQGASLDADPAEQSAEQSADRRGDEEAPSSERALMDKIAGLESMLTQVTTRLRNAEGHIGGLGSQLKQQVQAAQQVAAKGGEAPSVQAIRAASSDPEAMRALKQDYPEFANAMESALNERLQQIEQRLETQPAPAMQQPSVSQQDIQQLRSELAVEVRHPGWQGRVQTPEFVGWLQRQPREVQMLAASESPQDAIRLLDLHDSTAKATTNQRNQRLSSAAAIPSGRTGSSVRTKSVEDMTPQEYWRYLDEVDRQKR